MFNRGPPLSVMTCSYFIIHFILSTILSDSIFSMVEWRNT
ncbi:hypothetical protein ERO13_D11G166820v2 [Gossypium hirsutum]|nr:hypothetical protein ERO13_D11G166820v2 [Gossypium hirsutum]